MTSQLRTLMNTDLLFWEQCTTRTHTLQTNLLWADSVKLEYPDRIQTQNQQEIFRNLQGFADYSMESLEKK